MTTVDSCLVSQSLAYRKATLRLGLRIADRIEISESQCLSSIDEQILRPAAEGRGGSPSGAR